MADGHPWPRISIVTPNLNNCETLEQTINSVIANNYSNLEYIIIDGNSKDGSLGIIERYSDYLFYRSSDTDSGQYDAINKGFTKSSGHIMAWLNSDDLYFPWTLRIVAEVFSEFPNVRWLTGLRTLHQRGATRKVFPFHSYPKQLICCGLFDGVNLSYIQQESVFWRRDLWDEVGGLDLTYKYAADFDLWRRFGERAELYAVETPLGGFHNRNGANRSVRFFEQYKAEVDRSIRSLTRELAAERIALTRRMRTFERWRWLHGVRGALRRILRVSSLRGPVLIWSRPEGRYKERYVEMIKE